jgi:hypothetical protein
MSDGSAFDTGAEDLHMKRQAQLTKKPDLFRPGFVMSAVMLGPGIGEAPYPDSLLGW